MFKKLRKRADFLHVAKQRKAWITKSFVIQQGERRLALGPLQEDHARSEARFGFTASKKVGNAVKRNRAKRLMREIVRLYYKADATRFKTPIDKVSIDYVLIARPDILDLDFERLQKDLAWALRKLDASNNSDKDNV